jgi:prophage regulatory protein
MIKSAREADLRNNVLANDSSRHQRQPLQYDSNRASGGDARNHLISGVVQMNAVRAGESLKILRLPQVCGLTGLGRSVIYQMEADLRFPQRIKLGTRAVGWLEQEVHAWLVKRIAASRCADDRVT